MLDLLVSFFLLVIWGLLLYFFRRNLIPILIGVAIGILGVFLLAGSIEFNWFKITGISLTEIQSKIVIAPIVEEFSKLLFIFLLAWFTHYKSVLFDIELFGAGVGLGFAFIENFQLPIFHSDHESRTETYERVLCEFLRAFNRL